MAEDFGVDSVPMLAVDGKYVAMADAGPGSAVAAGPARARDLIARHAPSTPPPRRAKGKAKK
jgi:hypothetical protein